MAIFRQGVRVGPFDLRLGLSRDKSLQNVDKDPRLRQYANTENQMGRFRAAMAAANGYARTTRFAVRIYPPTNLESMINQTEETDTRSGGNFDAMVGLITNWNWKLRDDGGLDCTTNLVSHGSNALDIKGAGGNNLYSIRLIKKTNIMIRGIIYIRVVS